MDSVLRKFRLRKERRESEARQKLKRELFSFNTCVGHGFPSKPSALAYDAKLRLLAVGTRSGDIRVYGAPGVEFYGQHPGSVGVTQIKFLSGQGRLVTVCSDGSVHLWQINEESEGQQSTIALVKSLASGASNFKTIHASCVTSNGEQLLLGVDGGSIRTIDILSFKLTDKTIQQDAVIAHAPDDFKTNPGTIVEVLQHPRDSEKFLIGYSRGLIILWDDANGIPTHTYNTSQQLESLSFFRDGSEFVSAHADGSYIIWASTEPTRQRDLASTPYGPFPCKAISKILWKSAKPEPFVIFSGGMPRASHGDKHTVSVMQGATHVVFDLSSKLVDFLVICAGDESGSIGYDSPHSLVLLTEEEVIVIDLTSEGWLTYNLPYLNSIHSSAILSASHVSNVPEAFWNKLVEVGAQQSSGHSTRDWPICGGTNLHSAKPDSLDLLLTGHEDGSVRFWDVSTTSMRLVYKLTTSAIFGFETPQTDLTKSQELEDEWPPFRKVGTYDPYSDDPQLGIQKISVCCRTETLVLGGTAGQIVVLRFSQKPQKHELQVSTVNVLTESESYVWKGHDPLSVRTGQVNYPAGFQLSTVVQVHPPSLCTSLAVHTDWKLLAIGTAFGYVLFDYQQNLSVYSKCTLSATGEGVAPRRKSLRRSIRDSFRRLRGRRTNAHHRAKPIDVKVEEVKADRPTSGSPKKESSDDGRIESVPPGATGETSSPPSPSAASPSTSPKHVEAKTESRTTEDLTSSIARCIYFADTFLLNAQEHSATLWVGTNAGTIFIHQIVLPSGGDRRDTEAVTCTLAKEIQLRHGAPVILISVVDRTMLPLTEPHMLEQGKAADMSGSHQVVICSEEQFKLFSLPYLKPSTKYKLTARDGTKVCKANIVSFKSKSDENYVEHDLACLTNAGQIHVFTVPQLRSQLKGDSFGADNTSINAGLFTVNGEGFFLRSVSEFVRLSLSARHINKPLCTIGVAEESRPPLQLADAGAGGGHSPKVKASRPGVEITAVVNSTADEEAGHSSVGVPRDDDDNKLVAPTTSNDVGATTMIVVSASENGASSDAAGADGETIKMQMSESSSSSVVVRNVTSSRTIVTKTTVSRTTDDGGTVTETSTNVQHLNTGHVHVSDGENLVPADGARDH